MPSVHLLPGPEPLLQGVHLRERRFRVYKEAPGFRPGPRRCSFDTGAEGGVAGLEVGGGTRTEGIWGNGGHSRGALGARIRPRVQVVPRAVDDAGRAPAQGAAAAAPAPQTRPRQLRVPQQPRPHHRPARASSVCRSSRARATDPPEPAQGAAAAAPAPQTRPRQLRVPQQPRPRHRCARASSGLPQQVRPRQHQTRPRQLRVPQRPRPRQH